MAIPLIFFYFFLNFLHYFCYSCHFSGASASDSLAQKSHSSLALISFTMLFFIISLPMFRSYYFFLLHKIYDWNDFLFFVLFICSRSCWYNTLTSLLYAIALLYVNFVTNDREKLMTLNIKCPTDSCFKNVFFAKWLHHRSSALCALYFQTIHKRLTETMVKTEENHGNQEIPPTTTTERKEEKKNKTNQKLWKMTCERCIHAAKKEQLRIMEQ